MENEYLSLLLQILVGFFAWDSTPDTFNRGKFHESFMKVVVPHLNPWPLPRSIVILDNAKIHMYPEIEHAIHQCGARLLYLPPYTPSLNPIEVCFSLLKRWINKNANLIFPLYPEAVLNIAMPIFLIRVCCSHGLKIVKYSLRE